MDYRKCYDKLMARSRVGERTKGGEVYYEEHHVVPRCMKGGDDVENLVLLSAREHFIAHCLLTKIYPENKNLIFALIRMRSSRYLEEAKKEFYTHHTPRINAFNSKLYSWIRRKFLKQASEMAKNSIWISNPNTGENRRLQKKEHIPEGWVNSRSYYVGMRWISNTETNKAKRVPKDYILEEGWSEGRALERNSIWIHKENTNTIISKKEKIPDGWVPGKAKSEDKLQQEKYLAQTTFDKFKTGYYMSVLDFCRKENINRAACNLTKLWQKYIPEVAVGSRKISPEKYTWIYNPKLNICRKIEKDGIIPEGWTKGRGKIEMNQQKEKNEEKRKIESLQLYKLFIQGNYKSIREFCVQHKKNAGFLSKNWKKHIPNLDEELRKKFDALKNK